jgi:hypothetical protein
MYLITAYSLYSVISSAFGSRLSTWSLYGLCPGFEFDTHIKVLSKLSH